MNEGTDAVVAVGVDGVVDVADGVAGGVDEFDQLVALVGIERSMPRSFLM